MTLTSNRGCSPGGPPDGLDGLRSGALLLRWVGTHVHSGTALLALIARRPWSASRARWRRAASQAACLASSSPSARSSARSASGAAPVPVLPAARPRLLRGRLITGKFHDSGNSRPQWALRPASRSGSPTSSFHVVATILVLLVGGIRWWLGPLSSRPVPDVRPPPGAPPGPRPRTAPGPRTDVDPWPDARAPGAPAAAIPRAAGPSAAAGNTAHPWDAAPPQPAPPRPARPATRAMTVIRGRPAPPGPGPGARPPTGNAPPAAPRPPSGPARPPAPPPGDRAPAPARAPRRDGRRGRLPRIGC